MYGGLTLSLNPDEGKVSLHSLTEDRRQEPGAKGEKKSGRGLCYKLEQKTPTLPLNPRERGWLVGNP